MYLNSEYIRYGMVITDFLPYLKFRTNLSTEFPQNMFVTTIESFSKEETICGNTVLK